MTRDNIRDLVFQAGIAGQGGAGYPTHAKLSGEFNTLLVNGAECEPLLRTDRYIMISHAEDLMVCLKQIAQAFDLKRTVLCLKASYVKEIVALEKAKASLFPDLELFFLDTYYPAGDEHTLVYEVMGEVIPPGRIPLSLSCVVLNVGTILSIKDALEGTPYTHKYVTVIGEVHTPGLFRVPIGTSVSDCIQGAGGAKLVRFAYILGGPMMGQVRQQEDAPLDIVDKTCSGIIVLSSEAFLVRYGETSLQEIANRSKAACIQCRMCTDLCPRYLLGHPLEPHKIMRTFGMAASLEEALKESCVQNALLCSECGVCELIACPMRIHPRRVNVFYKEALKKAGIQNSPSGNPPSPMRDYRKIPTIKAAHSTSTIPWFDLDLKHCNSLEVHSVFLPLKQSIGSPAQPIVEDGALVEARELIASCPQKQLGIHLHAPFSGQVHLEEDGIRIDRQIRKE